VVSGACALFVFRVVFPVLGIYSISIGFIVLMPLNLNTLIANAEPPVTLDSDVFVVFGERLDVPTPIASFFFWNCIAHFFSFVFDHRVNLNYCRSIVNYI
jgi:hypothetical protein